MKKSSKNKNEFSDFDVISTYSKDDEITTQKQVVKKLPPVKKVKTKKNNFKNIKKMNRVHFD